MSTDVNPSFVFDPVSNAVKLIFQINCEGCNLSNRTVRRLVSEALKHIKVYGFASVYEYELAEGFDTLSVVVMRQTHAGITPSGIEVRPIKVPLALLVTKDTKVCVCQASFQAYDPRNVVAQFWKTKLGLMDSCVCKDTENTKPYVCGFLQRCNKTHEGEKTQCQHPVIRKSSLCARNVLGSTEFQPGVIKSPGPVRRGWYPSWMRTKNPSQKLATYLAPEYRHFIDRVPIRRDELRPVQIANLDVLEFFFGKDVATVVMGYLITRTLYYQQ